MCFCFLFGCAGLDDCVFCFLFGVCIGCVYGFVVLALFAAVDVLVVALTVNVLHVLSPTLIHSMHVSVFCVIYFSVTIRYSNRVLFHFRQK